MRIFEEHFEHANERRRARRFASGGRPLEHGAERRQLRHIQRKGTSRACRERAAQSSAARAQIFELGRTRRRNAVLELLELPVVDRNLEASAERAQIVRRHALALMGHVARFSARSEAVTLDRLGQDHGGLPAVSARGGIRCVDLSRVMATGLQRPDLFVRHARDEVGESRVFAEEMLANVRSIARPHRLVFAVEAGGHALLQLAVRVATQQFVPFAAPDQLDHVPARTAKRVLELGDDFTVPAYGPIETLQVAIDDEHQIVELLSSRNAEGAQRLGFVHLTVAQKAPNLAQRRIGQLARREVLRKARVVDGLEGAESHRHGRELPEARHQPRVRVGRQAAAVDLAPKTLELLDRELTLQETTRIDPRRDVALEQHEISADGSALRVDVLGAVKEVVVTHLVQSGGRGVTR